MPQRTWQITNLSTNPPSYQLADTDRVALSFPAGEAITTATATIAILPTMVAMPSLIVSTTLAAQSAVVIVEGLTRGESYELAVTFTRADLTRWTRFLILECVG